jgi:large conductance mechanosensitive channel
VPVFAYGSFLTIAFNFLILAFIIFLMVKWINKLRAQTPRTARGPVGNRSAARDSR